MKNSPEPAGDASRRITIRFGLLLSLFCLLTSAMVAEVTAAEVAGVMTQDPAADDISLRQAYMSWLAAEQEARMNATIGYIAAYHGSVKNLSAQKEAFHASSLRISECNSTDAFDSILAALRDLTRQFQAETREQMMAASLNEEDLRPEVSGAVENDIQSHLLEDEYWMTRRDSEPAAFDRYIRESQETLSTLKEYGYNITPAQKNLDEIASMRSEFVAALNVQDFGTAELIRGKIQDASAGFEEQVRMIGNSGE